MYRLLWWLRGKESCQAGDADLIPGSGRSLGREDPWKRKWQPTPVFLHGQNPMKRGAWQATVHTVTKSQTRFSN